MRILTAKDYRSRRRRLARELAELLTAAAPDQAALKRWETAVSKLWQRYAAMLRLTRKQRPRCSHVRQCRSRCGAPPLIRERLPEHGKCRQHGSTGEPRSFPFNELDFDLELTHVPGKPTVMASPLLRVFVDFVEVDAGEWLACRVDALELGLVDYA